VLDDPVPELYVVRVEYQPGTVVLSDQAMLAPDDARESKFSVKGVPNDVILPLLVKADDGATRDTIPTNRKSMAMAVRKTKRERAADWGVDLDIRFPLIASIRCQILV
jgi:hypothetical protein